MKSFFNHAAQFAGFSGIGMAAFVLDLAILALLTEIVGVSYLASAVFSFICATSMHYSASRLLVFRHTSLSHLEKGTSILLPLRCLTL